MNILTSTFTSPKIMYCGLGFVVTLISGVLLSNFGRPLNSAIFTIHKLSAVGTIILIPGPYCNNWTVAPGSSCFRRAVELRQTGRTGRLEDSSDSAFAVAGICYTQHILARWQQIVKPDAVGRTEGCAPPN